MKSKLIIIRGSPASGKSTLARNLAKKIKGKVALLIGDEFRWVMTAHENRSRKDYSVSFDNFLYALKNYLKSGYVVIVEDSWIKKHNDKATDITKVIKLGKKYKAKIVQIFLKGNWKTIKHINTLRPMVIPQKELKESYENVYSKKIKDEIIIDINDKNPKQIIKEVLKMFKVRKL